MKPLPLVLAVEHNTFWMHSTQLAIKLPDCFPANHAVHLSPEGCNPSLHRSPGYKNPRRMNCGDKVESGGDLCFRAVSSQVRSALRGLTSVFGMGTGGTLSSLPPEMVSYSVIATCAISFRLLQPGFPCLRLRSAPRSSALLPHPDNCTAMILTDRFQLVSLSWTLR